MHSISSRWLGWTNQANPHTSENWIRRGKDATPQLWREILLDGPMCCFCEEALGLAFRSKYLFNIHLLEVKSFSKYAVADWHKSVYKFAEATMTLINICEIQKSRQKLGDLFLFQYNVYVLVQRFFSIFTCSKVAILKMDIDIAPDNKLAT